MPASAPASSSPLPHRAEQRRSRGGGGSRREALIAAALSLIAAGGPQAATVRAIATRAGVTPGLIRHYFQGKDDLTRAAYLTLMERMLAANLAVLEAAPPDPAARLAAFVAASLRPPVVDAAAMGLWAGFIHLMRRDSAMRDVHEATYLRYRDQLQALIAALPRRADAATLRREAIACNAVIDGLWLEASALPGSFGADEAARIGLQAVGAILGLALPLPSVPCIPPGAAPALPDLEPAT